MTPQPVFADNAPAPAGAYSQGVRHGAVLYCSGALPVEPESGAIVDGGPAAQARQCLRNLHAVCAAAGTTLQRALRLTVYTTDLGRVAEINEAYAAAFGADPPARATVGVAALPLGAAVEIDAIVALA